MWLDIATPAEGNIWRRKEPFQRSMPFVRHHSNLAHLLWATRGENLQPYIAFVGQPRVNVVSAMGVSDIDQTLGCRTF